MNNLARKALMMVAGQNGPPTIEGAAKQLEVRPEAIDKDFGVVLIDPRARTYSVLVEMQAPFDRKAFSNPKIGPLKG
jgi:hypothetical protein